MEHNYLIHHGILGQKWGKKNGPPYPIAPGDHSAAEKKAAKKSSEMSNEELQNAINRKRLENKYGELSNRNKKQIRDVANTVANTADKISKKDGSAIKQGSKLIKNVVKTQKATEKFERNKAESIPTDELKKIVDRMTLEQEYDKLYPSGKEAKIQKTKDTILVLDALVGTAVTISNIVNSDIGKVIVNKGKKFVSKHF